MKMLLFNRPIARFLMGWSVVFVMVFIALAVMVSVFLIFADWLFDGVFTTAHQWLNRWSTHSDF